ncbi:MAG: SDR family oxidoreductase [Nitriliruptorales bacterium]|nr:SDR family oxidoreductase [Nitriliruptorales bacterium]
MELADKVVVVTGGASGIGAALCRRFAEESPQGLVVADVDADGAQAVADEVGGTPVEADLSTREGVEAVVEAARDAHSRIDLYCSNAGVPGGAQFSEDPADWQRAWDVNVMAHVHAAHLLLPEWLERGEGYLLGTVSAAGLLNHIFAAPYAASKAAALSVLEWLAIAHGPDGVRVSALCPQGVKTPMLEEDPSGFLAQDAMDPSEVADVVVAGIADERFLILPHPEVADYAARRGNDHDRWIKGMQRLRSNVVEAFPDLATPRG